MAEYWEVIYRAVGDFGDLMAKAAAAKAALNDLGKAAAAEAATEASGASAAAAAHKADSEAIKQEIVDLAALAAAAKAANVQTAFGGRSTMDQHLADMQRELQYTDLLNRAHWLNFTSPQQAFAWQQQQLNQKRLMNYADWANYTSPDQYLNYLQRQRAELTSLNSVMLGRAQTYRALTSAALDYTNAIQGTSKTLGQLGESGSIQAIEAALSGLPDQVTTTLKIDDAQAVAQLAAYRAMLEGTPRLVSTTEVIQAGRALGAVPLVSPVSLAPTVGAAPAGVEAAMQRGIMSAFAAQLARMSALRASVPQLGAVSTAQEAAQVAAFMAAIRDRLPAGPVASLLAGGTVPGSGAPPPGALYTSPSEAVIGKWERAGAVLLSAAQEEKQAAQGMEAQQGGLGRLLALESAFLASRGAGGAGGGGRGGLPPAAGAAEEPPNPNDKAAWEALAGALHDVADGFGEADKEAVGLGDAIEGTVITTVQDAIDHVESLGVTSAKSAGQLGYILSVLRSMSQEKISDLGMGNVQSLLEMITRTGDVGSAAKVAYAAFQEYKKGLSDAEAESDRASTGALLEVASAFYKARASADSAAAAAAAAGGGFAGFGSKFVLWGGAFGNTMAGVVAGWHLWVDGIIEFLAVAVPALGALVIGLGAFGAVVYQTGNVALRMIDVMSHLAIVTDATGKAVPPFKDAWQKLQSVIQPQAWQLVGDAITVMNHNTGVFATIAEKTGTILDELAAKITNKLVNSSGKGLLDFFNIGIHDLSLFARLFSGLGGIIMDFIRATQETQVAEKLLMLLGDAAHLVATALGAIPVPLLAAGIGLHAFMIYGGLFTTWLQRAALGIDGLIAKIPGMSGFALSFAQKIGASTEQLQNLAASSGKLDGLARSLGITAYQAAQLEAYVKSTGMSMEEFARSTSAGSSMMDKYSAGLSDAGKESVAAGIAMGGTDEQIAKIAKDAESAGAKTSIFSKAMTGLGGFLASNWIAIAAIAAAAFGYIAVKALSASSGVSSFINNIKTGLSNMNAAQAFVAIPDTLGKIQVQLAQTEAAWNKMPAFDLKALFSWGEAWNHVRKQIDQFWASLTGQKVANPDQRALQAQIDSELKTYSNLSTTILGLTKQGYNFTQSLGVISAAGVNVNDSLGVMQQKVQGLISGYEFAGQRMGIVGDDMNVLSVTTSQTVTQMGKLNQAWDTWTQTVAGPVNSFLALNQGMSQFAQDAKNAGASMSGLGTKVSTTTTTASNNAATLQQDFQSLYSDVETVFDSIRMAEATYANQGGTGNKFVQSVKDGVAALIPLAGTNKAAAAEISALAQEAGGPATTNLKQLATWAGHVKDPMAQLQQLTQGAAIAASNLSQDAAQLTTTIAQELIPQMAASIIAASKAGPAMQNFATAVFSGHTSISQLAPSAQTLYGTLLHVSGNADNARALFIGFAESMHLSKGEATALANYVQQHAIKPKVDAAQANSALHELMIKTGTVVQPPPPAQSGWAKYWSYMGQQWSQYVWHPIYHFFGQDMPGWLMSGENEFYKFFASIGNEWQNWVNAPGGHFFDQLLPGWISEGQNYFTKFLIMIGNAWGTYVSGPVMRFFTQTVPGWLASVQSFFARAWLAIGNLFISDIENPMRDLFTHTIPGWWDSLGSDWRSLWSGAWSEFDHTIISPFSNFLTKTLPGWISNIGNVFGRAWNTAWTDFSNDIWKPVQNFFTKTVPGWLGLASGGDPGAFSGSVPGSSEADNYRAVVMGGEYVLRQPARMALEAEFGRGFMDWLNQFDTVSGAGSRGVLASQRGPGRGRYAGGGGILGDITSFFKSGASDLGHLGGSALHGLESLLSQGSQAVFNGTWNATVGNLLNDLPRTLSGNIAHWLGNEAKSGIDKMLGSVDSKTSLGSIGSMIGGAVGKLAGSGQVRQEQMYALSLFSRFGWNSGQLPDLISLWNRESGWNPDAVNPSSGAYGIPQALGKGRPYSLGDWVAQILWGLNYIKGRYGTPAGAWAHEVAAGWYAGGGPVVTAILNQTGDHDVREAMLLGSWFESRWNPRDYGQHSTAFGPYMIEPRKHKGVTKTEAQDPVWSTKFMYPYYRRAAENWGRTWKKSPEHAAVESFLEAERLAGSPYASPGRGDLTAGWRAVASVLGSGVEPSTSPGKGGDAVQEFNYWAGKIGPAWATAYRNWNTLARHTRPRGMSNANWEPWVADTLAIWQAEERVRRAWDNSGVPSGAKLEHFTNAQWETLRSGMDYWHGLLHGNTPPRSAWGAEHAIKWPKGFKAGSIRPSMAAAHVRFPGAVSSAYGAVGTLQADITNAFRAWQKAWGDRVTRGGGTPGITVRNPGVNNIPQHVNLGPLIYGAPPGGGPVGPGGGGFAAGGPIDVAALFAAGGSVPVPSFIMPGMSMTMQKQLAGAASSSSLPRTMGDAAGTSVGMQVGQLTINNPAQEKPSESITRASNRLAFMAGRGPF